MFANLNCFYLYERKTAKRLPHYSNIYAFLTISQRLMPFSLRCILFLVPDSGFRGAEAVHRDAKDFAQFLSGLAHVL